MKRLVVALILWVAFGAIGHAWYKGSPFTKTGTLNVSGPAYFTGSNIYLNWWKTGSIGSITVSGSPVSGQTAWDAGYYNSSTGELNTPVPATVTAFGRLFYTPVTQAAAQYAATPGFSQYANQVWEVKWDGCATPTVTTTGTLGSGGTSSFGSNTGTVTFGSNPSAFSNIGLSFTLTGTPGVSGCWTDPPRNIRVYKQEYAANVAAGELTDPGWRAAVRNSRFLRLMDVVTVNSTGISDSSQLAPLNYTYYSKELPIAWAGTASISGTTLTVAGANTDNNSFRVGQTVLMAGVTPGTTIVGSSTTSPGLCTPNCTGAGFNGTYAVSASQTVASTELTALPVPGTNWTYGPKGGVGTDIVCKIANEVGTGIDFPVAVGATNQFVTDVATALKACTTQEIKGTYSNENWNSSSSFLQYRYCNVLAVITGGLSSSGLQYSGYRTAQVLNIFRTVYGSDSGQGRWVGAFGSQEGNVAVSTAVLAGAAVAISGGGLGTLTQLAGMLEVAPYLAQGPQTGGGARITGISAAATPTVTVSGTAPFTNGQVLKLFVTGGTMAAALNNQYVTASSVSGSTFQINISTSGLTYGSGSSDLAMTAEIYKLADQSAALHASTPATYPTNYSYFAQQMSKATLLGTASDASYGTITMDANANLSGGTGSVQDLLSQHAVIALKNGLQLGQYEAGPGASLYGASQSTAPAQAVEYLANWQFDAGVVGDSTNTISNVMKTSFDLMCSLTTGYSGNNISQYNDYQPQSQFGPWGALRYIPGDETNPKWTAYTTAIALGRCTDPSPAATGTITYTPGDTYSSNGSGTSDTFSASIGTAAAYVIVPVFSQNFPTINSITVDGVALTPLVANPSSNVSAIYGGAVPAGSATRTVAINWTGVAFLRRGAWALKASGLTLAGAQATIVGTSLTVAKSQYLVAMGNCGAGSTTNNYDASTVASDLDLNDPNSRGSLGVWNAQLPFSTSLFTITPTATGCAIAAATFH